MTVSGVIDDVANQPRLRELIAWARRHLGRAMPLAELQALAFGDASAQDIEAHGERWTTTLVDLAQRGGLGLLERDGGGALLFNFVEDLPDPEQAWERAWAREDHDLHHPS